MVLYDDAKLILVVEENPSTMELIRYNLSKAGFQVLKAENAGEAMKVLKETPVDLIISDASLPDGDGFGLRDTLMIDPEKRDIPFIFLTVKAPVEETLRGLKTGVEEYITKPFNPFALIARIQAVITRREAIFERTRLDPLTGVLNRRTLELDIKKDLYRIKRYSGLGSLLHIDVDNFKTVNETYGHNAGDAVLIQLGHQLSINTRVSDIVGRFGGEQFVLFMPETKQDAAVATAQKLLNNFSRAEIPGIKAKMSFSAGVAEAPSHGEDFKTLSERAGTALLQAKKEGKGRVSGWDNSPETLLK